MFNPEKYNQGIRYRSRKAANELKAQLDMFNIGQTGELLKTINVKYKSRYGQIEAVGFTITKGGVFTEKGVGKGFPINSPKTNGEKLGRTPKAWFSPVLDATTEELADYILTQQSEKALNAIKF